MLYVKYIRYIMLKQQKKTKISIVIVKRKSITSAACFPAMCEGNESQRRVNLSYISVIYYVEKER